MPNTTTGILTAVLDWVALHPALATALWISAYFWYKVIDYIVIAPYCSPLQDLPGPPKPGKFFDLRDFGAVMNTITSYKTQQELREQYGKNIRIQGFGYWDQRLVTYDIKAINYILCQATELYQKPWQTRRMLCRLLGDGMPFTEGDQHKRQRKILSPAFSPQSLRNCYPIFHQKAVELRDRWSGLVNHSLADSTVLDLHHWIARATFDTFAAAGFDFHLGAIQNEDNEVYQAYKQMFEATINKGQTFRGFLEIYMPWLDWAWPNAGSRQVNRSKDVIKKAGEHMLKTKRDAIVRAQSGNIDAEKDILPKNQKDMLSLMIKSNLSENQKLTDSEILAQIHSFLFVGSDSISMCISWTLHYLSLNPALQSRLRTELLSHAPFTSSSSSRDIASLPFLDAVVKESLRIAAPVHSTLRVATCDDTIPTEDGVGVKINKGEFIHLPYEALNMAKEIWGEDAWEFNPDRWFKLPEAAKQIPALISGLSSFSVGSHSCAGMQFAIMEAKAYIAELVNSFEFTPVPDQKILKMNIITTKPFVSGQYTKGPQLPMIVRPYVPPTTTEVGTPAP
ncbi:hypothetical protein FRB94_006018 [Tulasnella sp. JGI-2019a]|nr:hypothetical protein FRB93_005926 [Tulasnella sp. JGI-2019a]KAG8999595.1 hypothetical protein FRB94_006018 [Tulasnella sp. JGI-2019a]KAG9028931.1 hypothetical protein FRB95_005883 [Tulasnella sp. JGI-2019a]